MLSPGIASRDSAPPPAAGSPAVLRSRFLFQTLQYIIFGEGKGITTSASVASKQHKNGTTAAARGASQPFILLRHQRPQGSDCLNETRRHNLHKGGVGHPLTNGADIPALLLCQPASPLF